MQTGNRHERSQPIEIIGAGWSVGAVDPGSAAGPRALLAEGLAAALAAGGRVVKVGAILRADAGESDATRSLGALSLQLASAVMQASQRGALPIVVGGDHSCAIGTWRGVAQAASGPIGLLWIDAHLDSHTPATTPSGALHGMPLAVLLGHGSAALTMGRTVLRPHQVAVVGVRSFEPDEARLLVSLGVRVFGIAEIGRRGLRAVMDEALAIVQAGTVGFGVTIDLDAVDPHDAPGVSTPAPDGLRAADLLNTLGAQDWRAAPLAIELAEYNPAHDTNHRTARLAQALLAALLREPVTAGALMAQERAHGAHNYEPLPVVIARGEGATVWDVDGTRYLDMLSAYSAVSLGHAHPRVVRVLCEQAAALAVTSRAFSNNRLPPFLARLCELTGLDAALPVNTGLEAVETALKAARKWAYRVKGVMPDQAEIIACDGNFHGRSIAIVAMSSEAQYRDGFGPFPPGFKRIPYGDIAALERAITPNTAAFLVEPVQGEGGIIVPPRGYLAACARLCKERNVLLLCDEIQTGLGRTGRFLACEHEGVLPDGVMLGKALGGGLLPVSAFVARAEVMAVFTPGDHGSTFGGNPLAAAVGLEALNVIVEERLADRAAELGDYFRAQLSELRSPLIREVRGMGLLIGVDLDPTRVTARTVCEQLVTRGVLCKDTHGTVVRFAPPLVVTREQVDVAVRELGAVLAEV